MQLLSEEKLVWSPTVANSRMNRERKSSGVNSYEKEFKFKPETYLEYRILKSGHSSWFDLCCGEGNALIQTGNYLYYKGFQQNIKLDGVDLLDNFKPFDSKLDCITLESRSVINFTTDHTYDLITCCHGIHYVGDKLKVIQTAIRSLASNGMFIANLDLNNISIAKADSKKFLMNFFKEFGIAYNSRTKILKRIGFANVQFGLQYIGADDTAGPNYSGQDAVTSYYS